MNLPRQRPTARPVGTDGSDYSYRMTVDPKYTKVAEGKARLKLVLTLQAVVQLLCLLYLFIFPLQAVEIDPLTASAVCSGVIFCTLGELGRRGSKAVFLKGYRWFSPISTVLAVVAVFRRRLLLMEIKDSHGDIVFAGMTLVDLFFFLHILIGAIVEIFQLYTTKHLLRNMTPSIN